jgi:hypothetical protein
MLGSVEGPAGGRFWAQVLLSPTAVWCLLTAIGCLAVLAAGLLMLRRSHRPLARRSPVRSNDGTATIEFALVTPILLFFALVLTQTTMLMAGHIFVNYSAFAATRSAIVQIPADYSDDGANHFTAAEGRTKHDAIKRAAVFAVAPVSGERSGGGGSVDADQFVASLRSYYSDHGSDPPRWLDTLAGDRLRYASRNTAITVITPQVDHNNRIIEYNAIGPEANPPRMQHTFQPRDPVTVRVDHRLSLGVPYVNRIFADGEHDSGGGRYIEMRADYTLPLEGIRDELPPEPNVPRTP